MRPEQKSGLLDGWQTETSWDARMPFLLSHESGACVASPDGLNWFSYLPHGLRVSDEPCPLLEATTKAVE